MRLGERIVAVAPRCASLDPVNERLLLLGCQAAVALEFAIDWVGMPRRHTAGADRFPHHRRPARYRLVIRHRPGTDAPFGVAVDALVHQNGRDVVGVGNVAARHLGTRREIDDAAGDPAVQFALHSLTGNHC